MRIMGVSGLPGAGKASVSEIATQKGAMIVIMGDIIREEEKNVANQQKKQLRI